MVYPDNPMIFIVSVILTLGIALSALFLGFGPNVYRLTDKGVMSRAIQNAELEAMRYGDLYLRAGILEAGPSDSNIPGEITLAPNLFLYTDTALGRKSVSLTSTISVNNSSEGIKITARAVK